MPESKEALRVVGAEEEHGKLWIGGVSAEILNGYQPTPALMVFQKLEIKPWKQK